MSARDKNNSIESETNAEGELGRRTGYFPRHDTPLIPELITNERPENLDAYFDFVENILDKSFRDTALVHVALKTTKLTSLQFNVNDKDDTGDPPISTSEKENRSSSPSLSSSSEKKSGAESKEPAKKSGNSSRTDNQRSGKNAPAAASAVRSSLSSVVVPNHFIFSPRLIVHRDGSTFGKFKVGTKVSVDGIVDCYQRVKVDTNGAVTMKVTAGNLMDSGLSLDGLIQVNLLDEAIRDEISVKASVERESVCFSMLGSRDGAGTSALKADGDVRLFNLHVGCGVEHHWGGYAPAPAAIVAPQISGLTSQGAIRAGGEGDINGSLDSAEVGDGLLDPSAPAHSHASAAGLHDVDAGYSVAPNVVSLPPTSTLYIGAGCFGKGWHMAGKIFRDDGEWTEAQIVLYQNIHKLASVAAMYKVNTQEGIAETTIGVSRRFTLWGRKIVMAAKFSTSGLLSVLMEANLDAFTRIGVVSRFTPATGERPTFGILASLQSD